MAHRAKSGYVYLYVGKKHHLADVRGYAREHRLVAEKMIGRRLRKGEVVHHINGVRDDNRAENLRVIRDTRWHTHWHAKDPSLWRSPEEPNPEIACACGCGGKLLRFRSDGRRRDGYIHGHHLRGKKRYGKRGKIRST